MKINSTQETLGSALFYLKMLRTRTAAANPGLDETIREIREILTKPAGETS